MMMNPGLGGLRLPLGAQVLQFSRFCAKKGTFGTCVRRKWVRRLHGDLELGSRVPGGMVMDLFAIKVLDGAVDPTKRNL